MIVLAFAAAVLGFLLLGISTDRHHRKWLGKPCPKHSVGLLRIAAWVSLAASFALSMAAWGAIFGPVGYVAAVIAGATLAFCLLNFVASR